MNFRRPSILSQVIVRVRPEPGASAPPVVVARDGRTVALLPLPFPPNPDPTSKAKPAVDTKVTCTYRRADVRAFIPQRRRRLRCLVRYDSCPSSPARLPRGVFVVVVVVVDFQCLLTHLHTSHVLHMCNKRYTSELPHYILCPFQLSRVFKILPLSAAPSVSAFGEPEPTHATLPRPSPSTRCTRPRRPRPRCTSSLDPSYCLPSMGEPRQKGGGGGLPVYAKAADVLFYREWWTFPFDRG